MEDSDDELLVPESVTPTPTPSVTSSCYSPTPSLQFRHLLGGNIGSFTDRDGVGSIVRASMPELRTIKVKCRQPRDDIAPPLSVITTDMSATDLMTLILERLKVRGLEPSTYCVVARITTKGQDVGVETMVLEESSHPFIGDRDKLKRSRFSIRQKGGILAEVYDGRKWPVVRVGSVYVTGSDTAHRVTQSVLCTPNVHEKKRKAAKYTVAVGTTHGHVQAFIRDSELLLPVYQGCQAEEKCLILIKKPKDASKKMLKAQSLQNLSVSDTHLYKNPLDRTPAGGHHSHSLTAHHMKGGKGSSKSGSGPMVSENYTTEPKVRRGYKGGNPPPSSSSSNFKGSNSNFVPIPELGIFTPDQHVLQNGTYAQHCHQRDVTTSHNSNNNNNNNNSVKMSDNNNTNVYPKPSSYPPSSSSSHPNPPSYRSQQNQQNYHSSNLNNSQSGESSRHQQNKPITSSGHYGYSSNPTHNSHMAHNNVISSHPNPNSSFEDSVKSDSHYNYTGTGSNPNAMLKRLDFHPARFQQQQQYLQENGVYHSCMDISTLHQQHRLSINNNDDDNFNTLSSTNSDFYSVRSSITGGENFDTLRSDTSNNDVIGNREESKNGEKISRKHFTNLANDQKYDYDHETHGFRSARNPVTSSSVSNRDIDAYKHPSHSQIQHAQKQAYHNKQHASSTPDNKMDPSSRSHSLGDLTSGLTISLVGQKKTADSVNNVGDPGFDATSSSSNRYYDSGKQQYVGNGNDEANNTGKETVPPGGRWGASHDKESRNRKDGSSQRQYHDDGVGGDEVDGNYLHKKQQYTHPKPSTTGNGGSALQHIRDRLQKAVLNSQKMFQGSSSNGNNTTIPSSSLWKPKGKDSENKAKTNTSYQHTEITKSRSVDSELSPLSSDRVTTTFHADSHVVHSTHVTQQMTQNATHQTQSTNISNRYPHQTTTTNTNTNNNFQHHHQEHHTSQHPSPILRQNSAPGTTNSDNFTSSTSCSSHSSNLPSSHQNASSEQNLCNPHLSSHLPPPSSSAYTPSHPQSHHLPHPSQTQYTSISHSSTHQKPSSSSYSYNKSTSSNDNTTTSTTTSHHKTKSTSSPSSSSSSSTSNFPPNGNQSPSKSKRSLPDVSLTQKSERIRKFTEIMKARSSSNHSRNGGYSADGSTCSQNTPTRVSSVDSTCSDNQPSRKSSADFQTILESLAPSDESGVTSSRVPELQREPRFDNRPAREQQQGQLYSHSRTPRDNETHPQPPPRHTKHQHGRGGAGGNDNDNNNYGSNDTTGHHHQHHQHHSQGHDDLVLPSGDHSSDSAHTTGTSTSYTGSTLDSGYTTNNDGDNDYFHNHSHNKPSQHISHHKQFTQTPQQYLPHEKNTNTTTMTTNTKKRAPPPPPPKHSSLSSNLVNSHRFGSVQNISTAQAHGFPKDKTTKHDPLHSEHHPALPSGGESLYGTLRKAEGTSYFNNNEQPQQITPMTSGGSPLLSNRYRGSNDNTTTSQSYYPQSEGNHRSANVNNNNFHYNDRPDRDNIIGNRDTSRSDNKPCTRRSWDYGNRRGTTDVENGLQRMPKHDYKYRSSDVLCSSRFATSNNNNNNNNNTINPSSIFTQQHVPIPGSSSDGTKNNTEDHHHQQQQNNQNHYHQQHQQPMKYQQQQQQQQQPNSQCPPPPPISNDLNPSHHQHHPSQTSSSSSSSSGWKDDTSGVKQRPVPVSRSHRNARGRTLPGGFRFDDHPDNPDFGKLSQFNFELSLYHLTQRYDLSALCLDLPKNLTLKDMMTLKDYTVEISLQENPGIPSSPQGKTSAIGSPGSAFTPVRHDTTQGQGQPTVLKVKVVTFCNIWEEVHNHSKLGRMFEGDILVEINGWFCLGADVPYLRRIVENCHGAITLTVARRREKDEVRYKGQTPAERIKGLELQIARLDDLVQARDEKIQDLQSVVNGRGPGSNTGGTGKQVLMMVNGEPPREGMKIGDDEYVV